MKFAAACLLAINIGLLVGHATRALLRPAVATSCWTAGVSARNVGIAEVSCEMQVVAR